jgi:hypothetical protein
LHPSATLRWYALNPRLAALNHALNVLSGTPKGRFCSCGVDLNLNQQSIDTTTPAGRLMFQITGPFAEFERSMIRQRVRAGLKRAVESGKQLGRPKIDPAIEKYKLSCEPRKACWPLPGIQRLARARFSVSSARWRRPALSAAPPRKAALRRLPLIPAGRRLTGSRGGIPRSTPGHLVREAGRVGGAKCPVHDVRRWNRVAGRVPPLISSTGCSVERLGRQRVTPQSGLTVSSTATLDRDAHVVWGQHPLASRRPLRINPGPYAHM